jgi:hypothetical protein
MTARSAVSPSSRHHSAIAFSVLNRKCGSRWLRSASSCARSASRACACARLGAQPAVLEPDVAPQAQPADQEQRQRDHHARRRGQERVPHAEDARHHDADRQHHSGADRAVEDQADAAVAQIDPLREQNAPGHRRDHHERQAHQDRQRDRQRVAAVTALGGHQRRRDQQDRDQASRMQQRAQRAADDRRFRRRLGQEGAAAQPV